MRGRSDQELLFTRARLSDALHAHDGGVSKRVQALSDTTFRQKTDEELIAELATELAINHLELDEAKRQMVKEEVEIDVTGDPRRDIFPRGRRVVIPGIRVGVTIPFKGDHELWHLQPNAWTTTVPRGNVHRLPDGAGGTLELVIQQAADEPLENMKAALERQMKDVRFYIDNQRSQLAGYENQLRHQIAAAVAERRQRLSKHDELSSLLGISEMKVNPLTAGSAAPPSRTAPRAATSTTKHANSTKWDVFVSHASEDKEAFARPLAEALRDNGLSVWFDEFTLTVGDSLRRSIDRGLASSRFGIVIVSEAFLSKEWPQKELDGLVAREYDGQKVILPVWHEITAEQVRRHSPTLADRLAIASSMGISAAVAQLLEVIRPGSRSPGG